MQIYVSGEDQSVAGGLCPDGDHFRYPAALVGVHFDQRSTFDDDASTPENHNLSLTQNIMSFERSDSADRWIGAYESCIDTPWHEEGDPDEYIGVEQIEIADPGVETAAFVVLYAHEDDGETAHDEGSPLYVSARRYSGPWTDSSPTTRTRFEPVAAWRPLVVGVGGGWRLVRAEAARQRRCGSEKRCAGVEL